MSKPIFSDNARRLRIAHGLTQQELARRCGLSLLAYRNIENGATLNPRVDSLSAIAAALEARLDELLAEPPALRSVRFRTQKFRSKRDEERTRNLLIGVARWLNGYNGLETLAGAPAPFKLKEVADACRARRPKPPRAAEMAREALGLDADEPIHDIGGLLESAGIKLKLADSELNFFGLSIGSDSGGPAIVINVAGHITVERRIFTAAHELGHLLMHPGAYNAALWREDRAEEEQANTFASHFLMPQCAFRRQVEETAGLPLTHRTLHIKRIFGVSWQTVLLRLSEGASDPSALWKRFYSEYKIRYGRALKKTVEPAPLETEDFLEDRLPRLVRQALESEAITLSRAAEILEIDHDTMRQRVESWRVATPTR